MRAKCLYKLLFVFIAVPCASPVVIAQVGQISLTVDATKTPAKIVKTRESIPVKAGPLTLYYPKWIPGNHGPDGPIGNVTGLKFTAGGKIIPWQRDLADVFTFHVDLPAGADHLDVEFEYLEPTGGAGFAGGAASSTDKLIVLEWNDNLLYPAGAPASQIMFHPKLILPDGWKFGTPQHVENQSGNEITFAPLSLEKLVRLAYHCRPVLSRDRFDAAGRTHSSRD